MSLIFPNSSSRSCSGFVRKTTTSPLVLSTSPHPAHSNLVYFPIYSPWVVDTQGEAITDGELMASAHDWMVRGRSANVDVEHDGVAVNCRVVESWITRGKSEFGPPGTWAGGMRIYDDELMERVRSGEINGVSLLSEYPPIRRRADTVAGTPVRGVGETEMWGKGTDIEPHAHSIDITFDQDGDEEFGFTGEALGHVHPVKYVTATEKCRDKDWIRRKGSEPGPPHAHRIGMDRLDVEYESKIMTISWMSSLSVLAISLVQHGANWAPFTVVKSVGSGGDRGVGGREVDRIVTREGGVAWPNGRSSRVLSGLDVLGVLG